MLRQRAVTWGDHLFAQAESIQARLEIDRERLDLAVVELSRPWPALRSR